VRILACKAGHRVPSAQPHRRRPRAPVPCDCRSGCEPAHIDVGPRWGDRRLRRTPPLTLRAATRPTADIVYTPPVYIAFDVIYRDGTDLTGRPLRERRAQLDDLVTGDNLVLPVRRLAPNGPEAWAMIIEHGYEGWVGKDESSPYRGGVTRSWLKVKVPGWTDPEDRWRRVRPDTP
jgi:hypothetical protein